MKVWKLALALLWHTLHGRGGDDVYLRLSGLSQSAEDEMDDTNWTVCDVDWSPNVDRLMVLTGAPEWMAAPVVAEVAR